MCGGVSTKWTAKVSEVFVAEEERKPNMLSIKLDVVVYFDNHLHLIVTSTHLDGNLWSSCTCKRSNKQVSIMARSDMIKNGLHEHILDRPYSDLNLPSCHHKEKQVTMATLCGTLINFVLKFISHSDSNAANTHTRTLL